MDETWEELILRQEWELASMKWRMAVEQLAHIRQHEPGRLSSYGTKMLAAMDQHQAAWRAYVDRRPA